MFVKEEERKKKKSFATFFSFFVCGCCDRVFQYLAYDCDFRCKDSFIHSATKVVFIVLAICSEVECLRFLEECKFLF
jgi:hypothetical protein